MQEGRREEQNRGKYMKGEGGMRGKWWRREKVTRIWRDGEEWQERRKLMKEGCNKGDMRKEEGKTQRGKQQNKHIHTERETQTNKEGENDDKKKRERENEDINKTNMITTEITQPAIKHSTRREPKAHSKLTPWKSSLQYNVKSVTTTAHERHLHHALSLPP